VDGQSLLGTSHLEAVHALQNLSSVVTLLVCDGYNGRDVMTEKHAEGISTLVCIQAVSLHLCYSVVFISRV